MAEEIDRNYPRCKYRAGGEPILVRSMEEENSLVGDWYNSPADVPEPTKKVKSGASKS